MEEGIGLGQWMAFCLAMVRRKGTLTVVHRADRVDALVAALVPRAGEIVIFPLWPRQGEAAKRVIVQARMGVAAPAKISPGLILHRDGRRDFTVEADAILRGGQALRL
jgi:tRNA1(Val) A37 N6-methylase TrmN6